MAPVASATAAVAARRVCAAAALPEAHRGALADAFGDEALLSGLADPEEALVKACRRAIDRCPHEASAPDLDRSLAEALRALWGDAAWREAWSAGGLAADCPVDKILRDARFALSYGDSASNKKYFQNFGRFAVQATMLQDETRTGTYHRAILQNRPDFEGKVVMDVGSGTGMLAFFAVQAGAARVYCIEASPMAQVIRELAADNGWSDRIVVVNMVLQDIRDEVPEKVDVITHETLGNFLFAERGIETVLVARDRFLKPGGRLYPTGASFCLAPFEDGRLHNGRLVKSMNLWTSDNFYGVKLSAMHERSKNEMFSKALSDQFHPDQLRADATVQYYDFRTLRPEEVIDFEVAFDFASKATCVLHGVAGWFEAHFEGALCNVILSTSPWDTLTHWWQTRLMLLDPLAVNEGQRVTGSVSFEAREGNTYSCRLVMESGGLRREQGGFNLADCDASQRAPVNKVHQITPFAKVSMIDWEASKPTPCSAGGEALVGDPLRQAKLDAAQSETSALAGMTGSAAGSRRTFGSQVRVNNTVFMLVDDQETCKRWTSPQAALVLVGSLGESLVMRPQDGPDAQTCLIEIGSAGGPRCWLEVDNGIEHMRRFVCENKGPASADPMTRQQAEALDTAALVQAYLATKEAVHSRSVSFRSRAAAVVQATAAKA